MHENWNHRPFQTQQKQEASRDEQGQSRKREKRSRLFCLLLTSNTSPETMALSCCQILNSARARGRWARQTFKTSSWTTQENTRPVRLVFGFSSLRIKERVSSPGKTRYSREESPLYVTGTHASQIQKYEERSSLEMCRPAASQGFWLDPAPQKPLSITEGVQSVRGKNGRNKLPAFTEGQTSQLWPKKDLCWDLFGSEGARVMEDQGASQVLVFSRYPSVL